MQHCLPPKKRTRVSSPKLDRIYDPRLSSSPGREIAPQQVTVSPVKYPGIYNIFCTSGPVIYYDHTNAGTEPQFAELNQDLGKFLPPPADIPPDYIPEGIHLLTKKMTFNNTFREGNSTPPLINLTGTHEIILLARIRIQRPHIIQEAFHYVHAPQLTAIEMQILSRQTEFHLWNTTDADKQTIANVYISKVPRVPAKEDDVLRLITTHISTWDHTGPGPSHLVTITNNAFMGDPFTSVLTIRHCTTPNSHGGLSPVSETTPSPASTIEKQPYIRLNRDEVTSYFPHPKIHIRDYSEILRKRIPAVHERLSRSRTATRKS